MAQVGQHAQAFVSVLDDEAHPVGRVVGRRQRVDDGFADLEGLAGDEEAQVVHGPELVAADLVGGLGEVDRQAELALEDAGGADVVVVVVAEDDGLRGADVLAVDGHSALGLEAGDARVQQDPRPPGLDEDAVAVAAALTGECQHVRGSVPVSPVPATAGGAVRRGRHVIIPLAGGVGNSISAPAGRAKIP